MSKLPLSHVRDDAPLGMYLRALAAAALLALSGCATANSVQAASTQTVNAERAHYIDANALMLARVIAPPSSNESAATRAELDEMLRIQDRRTPESAERARLDAKVSVFRFADVLGGEHIFVAEKLPLTNALFRKLTEDEGLVISPAKDAFDRPRPFRLEPRLKPVLDLPASSAYPSGHATWGYAVGVVLADMVPEKRAEIMARAREYAHNRVVAGVHFPSDVESGALCGAAFAAMLLASPQFRTDQTAAAAELRAALGLPPLKR
jgi:acid phosphatase (class A)